MKIAFISIPIAEDLDKLDSQGIKNDELMDNWCATFVPSTFLMRRFEIKAPTRVNILKTNNNTITVYNILFPSL